MNKFNNLFTYDLNKKQKQIFVDLIESEPYFKAIASEDYSEIKNCLADMKIKYDNIITECNNKKLQIYNRRYTIGLFIACFMISDEDIFEQIYLSFSNCINLELEKQTYKQLLDILNFHKYFNLLNIVVGHLTAKNNSICENFYTLWEDINLREKTFQLVQFLQYYNHSKGCYFHY